MKVDKLVTFGAVGTVIAALCCFTPILVVILTSVSLATWLGWLDYVLLPLLALFIGLTIFALFRNRLTPRCK
ncbi:mercury resistance system transport protein MerF [Pseudomonadota bacterium]